MEASLIGKAVVFGSKECRFEPCVSNLMLTKRDNLISLINLIAYSKRRKIKVRVSKNTSKILKLLASIGAVTYVQTSCTQFYISINKYKLIPFFSQFKRISSKNKPIYITLNGLKRIRTALGSSQLLIETSNGLITHSEAIKMGTGGKVLTLVSS